MPRQQSRRTTTSRSTSSRSITSRRAGQSRGRTDAQRAPAPERTDRSGIHILMDRSVARRMVRSAGLGPDDLVMEPGAGTGVLTAALAATGARVVAIERNAHFVDRLQRRFTDESSVRVVAADARTVDLPRRHYRVVANIPYAISTLLLRRLLSPEATSLRSADLLVEWGFAKRVTQRVPRDVEAAWWQARFAMHIAARVPPESFNPVPAVNSAHLVIRRRTEVSRRAERATLDLLRASYRSPRRTVKDIVGVHVPKKRAHRLLTSTGVDPPTPGHQVPPETWVRLAEGIVNT